MVIKSFKKALLFCLGIFCFLSCDRLDSRFVSFRIENNSSQDIMVVYTQQFFAPVSVECFSEVETELFISVNRFQRGQNGFGLYISDIVSFEFINLSTNANFLVTRPDDIGYIDEVNGIGETREEIQNDIYNLVNWNKQFVQGGEIWTYTINEEDLTLFE